MKASFSYFKVSIIKEASFLEGSWAMTFTMFIMYYHNIV